MQHVLMTFIMPFYSSFAVHHPHSLLNQLCGFFKILQDQFVLPKYPWNCVLLPESGWLTRGYTQRNCLSLSQKLIVASSSTAWGGSIVPDSSLLAAIWSGLILPGFLHAVTTAVSSLCSCSDVSWRQYFCSHSLPLSLPFILSPL